MIGRHTPALVTIKMRAHVWNLRGPRAFSVVAEALRGGCRRGKFSVVHFSAQRDHLHLIVEAGSNEDLARGMQGLSVRIARGLNKVMKKSGAVMLDRFIRAVAAPPNPGSPRLPAPACWLLRIGWRKHGLIDPAHTPRV